MEKAKRGPNQDEIRVYIEKLGYEGFDVAHFWAYHEARGWQNGSWKRSVVTWQKNTLLWRAQRQTHPSVFEHAPGWDPRPDEALEREGVDLEALRKARETVK